MQLVGAEPVPAPGTGFDMLTEMCDSTAAWAAAVST